MLMTAAKVRGMSLHEAEELTIGQFVDFVITYNEIMDPVKPDVRKATQANWDSF